MVDRMIEIATVEVRPVETTDGKMTDTTMDISSILKVAGRSCAFKARLSRISQVMNQHKYP